MNNADIVVAPSFVPPAPKQWRHRYDRIVFLKLNGWTHENIADEVGLSVSRVNVVLNSRPGKERMELWRARLEERGLTTIEEELLSLGKRAVKNIAVTINADIPKIGRAKKHQDQVSFEVLARIGFGKHERKKVGGASGLAGVQPELQKRLIEAIEKSTEATRIYEMPDADVEFVEIEQKESSDASATD